MDESKQQEPEQSTPQNQGQATQANAAADPHTASGAPYAAEAQAAAPGQAGAQQGYWQGTYQQPAYGTPGQPYAGAYTQPNGAASPNQGAYQQPNAGYAYQQAGGTYQQPGQNAYAYQQGAQQPYQQAYYQPQPQAVSTKDHVAAGLLAIFLGSLGIHKFYLGYNTAGIIMLAITVLAFLPTFGLASAVMWVISIVEGIIYLAKSQTEFEQQYVLNQREWF